MDYFLQNYKRLFNPLAVEHGYRTYSQSYYRVTNDIVKYFVLRRISGGSCTVLWSVMPLCLRITKSSLTEGMYEIGSLTGVHNGWEYDPHSEGSMLNVLNEMYAVTRYHLLPLLDSAVNSASAYRLECRFDGGSMLSSSKICYAIKMGDYNLAIQHLQALEAQNLEAYMNKMNDMAFLTNVMYEDYVEKFNEKLSRIRYQIERLSIPDMDYISNFVTENEEVSLRSLGVKRMQGTR